MWGDLVNSLVGKLPWVDILTLSAVAQIKKALSESNHDQRERLIGAILDGRCLRCYEETCICAPKPAPTLRVKSQKAIK